MLTGDLSELVQTVLHKSFHEILATQCSISVHGFHFEDLFLNGYHCHIQGASTYVNDQYVSVLLIFVRVIDS